MLKNLIRRVGKKCKNNQTEHLVPACCMCCLQAAVLHCSGYLASAEHRMQNFPGIRDEKKLGSDSQIIRAKYRVPIFTLAGWKIANFNGFNFNPEQSFILASLSSSNEVQRNNFPLSVPPAQPQPSRLSRKVVNSTSPGQQSFTILTSFSQYQEKVYSSPHQHQHLVECTSQHWRI